ncbi:MAG: hypothetical protein F6K25_29955 [Okeania sp. SIO2G4]|uniref:hypothetical protein n=1 Tax=unclassified Okeania TaxID=2634635 RepID=UPI0013BC71E9|nr:MULTISPECIES: hypothetical protein [unclassified Okeania]NEP41017.1 hypothetical protein [Okeania sp. SIO2H7]NEP74703.1 hypothetical protein [Okeania sp. SIO2G5]NEP95744.1 hypothetical protein [Okeania sp. SIO2F5]NEQ94635.1 hypothetical protein [Okeania sp. SIO2G4]
MSSDFLSKVVDPSPCAYIYAHAQKNVGLSGVTAVVIRKSILENSPDDLPELLDYRTHIERGVGELMYDINLNYLGVRSQESGVRRKERKKKKE